MANPMANPQANPQKEQMQLRQTPLSHAFSLFAAFVVLAGSFIFDLASLPADALVIRANPLHLQHLRLTEHKVRNYGYLPHRPAYAARFATAHGKHLTKRELRLAKLQAAKLAQARKLAARPIPPQNFADQLVSSVVAPGVVHRYCRRPLNIHILDIDMATAPIKVQPYLAGGTFDRLSDVADHARECNAIAAINANYFKKNGTPLGTLIINGEWVAGPIYDRVSMGITASGEVKIDRVSLSGLLTSDNPNASRIWVNNINQPRRSGSHLVAYTRRWGSFVRMDYSGCLVAVNAQGEVVDKANTSMGIPYGGYVLSDSKNGPIDNLVRGDKVNLSWQTRPGDWQDVVQAVSGGPMLIKDGKLFLDLKDENFKRGWTGAQIKARTVAGVTANNHLLLATIEGPHTLWDCAKFLRKLGAVDAMNLDGGGSTTMIVNGQRVTGVSHQRRVATSIVLLDTRKGAITQGLHGQSMQQAIEAARVPSPIKAATTNERSETTAATTSQGSEMTAVLPPRVIPVDSNKSGEKGEGTPATPGLDSAGSAPVMVP